jgi:hypothetical protein
MYFNYRIGIGVYELVNLRDHGSVGRWPVRGQRFPNECLTRTQPPAQRMVRGLQSRLRSCNVGTSHRRAIVIDLVVRA